MWPIAKQLYDEAPVFHVLVLAACGVTAVGVFSAFFNPVAPANASPLPPIPTGPGSYLSPYPTPPAALVPAPAPVVSLQAQQPVVPVAEPRTITRPLIDTSSIVESRRSQRSPQHAVAPGAVSPRTSQPRPLIEP